MRVNKIHPKSDNTDIANFIRETFYRRECNRFCEADSVLECCCIKNKTNNESISSSKPDSPNGNSSRFPIAESICKCGHSKAMHTNESVGPAMFYNMSKSWNVDEDTETFPTNAHGKIEFDESDEYRPFNKPTIKRFIRLDYKVDSGKVLELFRDYWKMEQPQLFLSVISSDTRRNKDAMEIKMEKFCEKLVEAATQTNAWIITEGLTEGIGGIVGDKIEKILDEKGKRPKAVLSICNWGCVKDKHRLIKETKQNNHNATHSICSKCGGKTPAIEFSLDRNHTNFILVDDGRQFHPGCERIVRQKLELKLREYETEESEEYSSTETSIPFIYFLIGGNINDILSVERALANEISVVIAKGTGGAADLIAEVVKTKEVKTEQIVEILDIKRDSKDLDHVRCNLRLILKSEGGLLALFDASDMKDASQNLSLCILTALKVNRINPTDIFVLAADWDNKLFFKDLLRERPKGSDLEDVMCKLLLKNSHSYVEVLLDTGVDLVEVVKEIKDLELTDVVDNEIVAHLMNQITSGRQNFTRADVQNKIGKLLCIWSAYKGMTEMAKVFWREGKDYLAMALMAYRMSKERKRKLAGKEGCNAMREQMKNFETLSTGFLLTCDTASRQNTIALLRGRVPDLNHHTPMQIAFDGDFKEFVAQPSFQELLMQIWTKRIIEYDKKMYIPLAVSLCCPFAAATLFEYADDEQLKENFNEHSPTMRSFLYFFLKVRSFLDAPVIKFIYNTLTYLAYLVVFSIVMLTEFWPKSMSSLEIVLTIWTFILIVEECRQASIFRREYLNKWNLLDVLALTLYAIGFILRIIHLSCKSICPECFYAARIVLAFSLLLSILRVLQLLSINPILGPKIYMINRLLKDLISFMIIMAVVISAYGVVSNVIMYPSQPLNAELLQDVFYDAWWSLIGGLNTEDTIGSNCNATTSPGYCSDTTSTDIDYKWCKQNRCPANTWIVSVLLAFYALITVIMMLNVLIAMFNVTFTKVEGKQDRVSKMQRYRLIREYNFRSKFPAPLCVFAYLKYIPWLCKLCKYCCCTEDDYYSGKMFFPPLEPSTNMFSKPLVTVITIWEQSMREKYEEEIRIRQLSEIAAMVPTYLGGGRGNVYNMVLHNPNYVNTLMQYSFSQMEQRLSVQLNSILRRDNKKSDVNAAESGSTDNPPAEEEHRNETTRRDGSYDSHQSDENLRPRWINPRPAARTLSAQGRGSNWSTVNRYSPAKFRGSTTDTQPNQPKLTKMSDTQPNQPRMTKMSDTQPNQPRMTKMSDTQRNRPRLGKKPPKGQKPDMEGQQESCIYNGYCYEIEEDDQSRRGGRKKRKSKSVKAYPGRYQLSKPTCSSSDCKMIIKCKDGRVIELETPFRKYGVPPKSSQFPAYSLPLKKSDIRKINFKCQHLPEDRKRPENKAAKTKEVKIRMPYGGVVLPPDKDENLQTLFDHTWHRGKSAPVVLNRSPPQTESVKVKDIRTKSARRRGEIATFLPSKDFNPELS